MHDLLMTVWLHQPFIPLVGAVTLGQQLSTSEHDGCFHLGASGLTGATGLATESVPRFWAVCVLNPR